MKIQCPNCKTTRPNISKNGFFKRKSDSKIIQKFICKICNKQFSTATFSPCYHQNKRRLNFPIRNLLCSSVSMRRIAIIHNISRNTVKRKLEFLAAQAELNQKKWLKSKSFNCIEFDDLESFEHTKCKPISVTMLVESKSRKIIGFKASSIGAKGLLAKPSRKKYGRRKNESFKNRRNLFKDLKPYIIESAVFKTDMHKDYPRVISHFFPKAVHKVYKGEQGALTGQGELKKTKFDPLFSINHTLAMLRANINRLVRKTWCTTKKMKYLEMHIQIYVDFHNSVLT